MLTYLEDKSFVKFVLERGNIPFVIRGSMTCLSNFSFAPFVGVRISGPTYPIRVIGENPQQEGDAGTIHVRELIDEAVFPGEVELPERSKNGISQALYGLELWADFVCLAVGNPKIVVEVQRPINPIISTRSTFDVAALERWGQLSEAYSRLETRERKKIAGAMWWYRKACATAYYSLFDSYAAYWNCLEILCNVAASRIHKGTEVDNAIQEYLQGKSKVTAGRISHCYHSFVNYSIKEQMKDVLNAIMGEEQAAQVIYQCFKVKPEEDRLYRIRNDINHGNIRENSGQAYERVYYRGMLLWNIVMDLLHRKLGHPISLGVSVNKLAQRLADPAFHNGCVQ